MAVPADYVFHNNNIMAMYIFLVENGDFKYSKCFRSLTMYFIVSMVLHVGVFEY